MSTNFRSDFHTELAELALDDIQYQRSRYYYFLGKVDKWNSTDTPDAPPEDTLEENNLLRANMLYAKKISPSDVSLATKNYIWSLGQVWDQWDHTVVMAPNGVPKQFYCLTSDDRVYKCLDRPVGTESSIMPTGTSIAPIRLDDGYLWKYMYTIPAFKKSRFVTGSFIPVQRALTDNFFNKGELDSAVVTASGSGYSDTALTTITVSSSGHTTGSGAVGTVTLGSIGQITGWSITNGGSGYTKGVKIDINHTTGSGAVLEAVIVAGVVTGINIVSAGIGYNAGTTITFRVGGAILIPKISAQPGAPSVTGVIIKDPGAGYSSVPPLTLVSGSGTGKYHDPNTGILNTSAIINAIIDNGEIKMVSIVDPGVGYQVGTGTTITVQGDGENAAMTPVVYNGELIDVILDNPGTGYTYTIITVTDSSGGSGSGAIVKGIIDDSDFESDQSIIEQTAVPGAIYSIGIADGGNGYVAPIITIHGDGTGATATCTVKNGVITSTFVTNFGSGYNNAWITISDASGSGAELYPILPPTGGHGSNAPNELFADTLAYNTSLRESIITTAIEQDFRQFGILKNPRDSINFANFVEDSALIVYEIIVDNTTGLLIDEVLVQSNSRYRVAEINGSHVYLIKLSTGDSLTEGTLIAEDDPMRDYLCQTIVSTPNFNKYSGQLLYISHEAPFKFTSGQGIVIKTFIKF